MAMLRFNEPRAIIAALPASGRSQTNDCIAALNAGSPQHDREYRKPVAAKSNQSQQNAPSVLIGIKF
jgi:hypothetical protein